VPASPSLPRIKELRNHQNELQRLKDDLIGRMESDKPAQVDKIEIMSCVSDLGKIHNQGSFTQKKPF